MSGLYIHIPFCEKKCIYCSFYSIESFANKDRFLDALHREIAQSGEIPSTRGEREEIRTIFFGGGTPSMLSPDEMSAILSSLRTAHTVVEDAEITMECNPGALNRDWLEGYREGGINRLSFGVQSFHDDELQFLSRIHTAAEAEENIRIVRDVFDNVSLDMIFALPGQTPERWHYNLERAVDLGTDHISAYSLIFEEGTPLNAMRLKGKVNPAPNDLEADMYEETVEFLAQHGLEQYETSNYAKPGYACRHNIGYWERKSYTGYGPSAHSFARRGVLGKRWANVSSLNAYLESIESGGSPVIMREELTPEQGMEEIVMLGLRYRGINLHDFKEAVGEELTSVAADRVEWLLNEGFALLDEDSLRLTAKGSIFADRFALEIIEATERSRQLSSI
ncbi:MAG: radical SAM family heme chaperone HemW [Candidatus Kapaibacterium sp.]